MASLIENGLTCAVCFGHLEEPKQLVCGHTFCKKCLEGILKSQSQLTCPLCRHITSVPWGDVSELSTNNTLKRMVEALRKKIRSREESNVCIKTSGYDVKEEKITTDEKFHQEKEDETNFITSDDNNSAFIHKDLQEKSWEFSSGGYYATVQGQQSHKKNSGELRIIQTLLVTLKKYFQKLCRSHLDTQLSTSDDVHMKDRNDHADDVEDLKGNVAVGHGLDTHKGSSKAHHSNQKSSDNSAVHSRYRSPNLIAKALSISICILTLCPVLVGIRHSRETMIMREGSTGQLTFHLEWPPHPELQSLPFVNIRFNSSDQPFWDFEKKVENGFKSRTQQERFEISERKYLTALSLAVDITIHDMCSEDEDVYVLTLMVFYNVEEYLTIMLEKEISVHTPPEEAQCFIALSDWVDHTHEVHCKALSDTGYGSLTCFQDNVQLNTIDGITHDGHYLRQKFYMMSTNPLSCCSYGLYDSITHESCRDFQWPFRNHNEITISHVPSTYKTADDIDSRGYRYFDVIRAHCLIMISFFIVKRLTVITQ